MACFFGSPWSWQRGLNRYPCLLGLHIFRDRSKDQQHASSMTASDDGWRRDLSELASFRRSRPRDLASGRSLHREGRQQSAFGRIGGA
jgi:hypothetical protein